MRVAFDCATKKLRRYAHHLLRKNISGLLLASITKN
jgi:hypothetical protein